MTIPTSLEDAIQQSKAATLTALESGCQRIQVDLVFPEIALQAQAIARQYTELFAHYGSGLKVLFADTGAAALARRDWGETEFRVNDLGSRFTPVTTKISDTDEMYLVVCPSSVEVEAVEKLCNATEGKPVVILIPQLESVATVGIGYAARQLRDRFLSTLETAYYIRPFEGGVVFRQFPSLWQVWLAAETEAEEGYELIAEEPQRPAGEGLERILLRHAQGNAEPGTVQPKKMGVLGSLQQLFRALSQ
jgi:hypothetical protein